jgi:hypothetical protein
MYQVTKQINNKVSPHITCGITKVSISISIPINHTRLYMRMCTLYKHGDANCGVPCRVCVTMNVSIVSYRNDFRFQYSYMCIII